MGGCPALAHVDSMLEAVAAVSNRPAVCRGAEPLPSWLWQVAGRPKLAAYCGQLAWGYARLGWEPSEAVEAAEHALGLRPGDGAAMLLRARALGALGARDEAWKAFEGARRALGLIESPKALHEYAVLALATGHAEEASAAYRTLVPRASLLDDESLRQRAHIEGAIAVMHDGQRGAVEAVSYLTEIRRGAVLPGLEDYVAAALALALDRQGRASEARGVLVETDGPWALEDVLEAAELPGASAGTGPEGGSRLVAAAPIAVTVSDLIALTAILSEASDPALAQQRWQDYLEGPDPAVAPWRRHAEAKLSGLRRPRGEP